MFEVIGQQILPSALSPHQRKIFYNFHSSPIPTDCGDVSGIFPENMG